MFILAAEPLPNRTAEEMRKYYEKVQNTRQLVNLYAAVNNQLGWVAGKYDDCTEEAEEFIYAERLYQSWSQLHDDILQSIMVAAEQEGLLLPQPPTGGFWWQLIPFMEKYGYQDGRGWWIPAPEK